MTVNHSIQQRKFCFWWHAYWALFWSWQDRLKENHFLTYCEPEILNVSKTKIGSLYANLLWSSKKASMTFKWLQDNKNGSPDKPSSHSQLRPPPLSILPVCNICDVRCSVCHARIQSHISPELLGPESQLISEEKKAGRIGGVLFSWWKKAWSCKFLY